MSVEARPDYPWISRGPMMRVKAKKLKESMMILIKEFQEAFGRLEGLREQKEHLLFQLVRNKHE